MIYNRQVYIRDAESKGVFCKSAQRSDVSCANIIPSTHSVRARLIAKLATWAQQQSGRMPRAEDCDIGVIEPADISVVLNHDGSSNGGSDDAVVFVLAETSSDG